MQYKIPQDVQMEDKIVGPLTLKQLIILGAGGGLDYAIYVQLAKGGDGGLGTWIVPVAIIGLLTIAIAFVKLKGLTFMQYAFYSIEFYTKPHKRLWTQGGGEVFASITQPKPKTKEELAREKQTQKAPKEIHDIAELSRLMDAQSEILSEKHEELQKIANVKV